MASTSQYVHPLTVGPTIRNYKRFHFLVLFVVVNSDYKYTDVGAKGATCDAQVFNLLLLKKALEENALCVLGTMQLHPKGIESPVMTACCLHNILRESSPAHCIAKLMWRTLSRTR